MNDKHLKMILRAMYSYIRCSGTETFCYEICEFRYSKLRSIGALLRNANTMLRVCYRYRKYNEEMKKVDYTRKFVGFMFIKGP